MWRSHSKQPASLICRHKKEKGKTSYKNGILGKGRWLWCRNHLGNIIKLFSPTESVLTLCGITSILLPSVLAGDALLAPSGSCRPNAGIAIQSLWCHLPFQNRSWRDLEGAPSQLSLRNNNVTDCKNYFLTMGETVRRCCVMYKRREEGNKKIPQWNKTAFEQIHLPKAHQMVKQVQVRRHQGNMKKGEKRKYVSSRIGNSS